MGGFIPAGMIATFSQAVQLGRKPTGSRRRKRGKSKRKSGAKKRSGARKSTRSRGKPRPGTKAWMAYIRTKRKKR